MLDLAFLVIAKAQEPGQWHQSIHTPEFGKSEFYWKASSFEGPRTLPFGPFLCTHFRNQKWSLRNDFRDAAQPRYKSQNGR